MTHCLTNSQVAKRLLNFWGTHDTTEYLDAFKTVDTMVDLRRRYYEVEIEQDVAKVLRNRARKGGTTPSRLASKLLREQLL